MLTETDSEKMNTYRFLSFYFQYIVTRLTTKINKV